MAGNLKTNTVQLGDSATDSQNFVLKTNVDGTGKLSRGAAGDLGDILVWNASGKLTLAAVPAAPAQSMIKLGLATGYGTTNAMIRRFTNVLVTQGADITYADSATLGGALTINTAGVYAISYCDTFGAVGWMGLSLNSASLSTAINTLSAPEVIVAAASAQAGYGVAVSSTLYLASGAVVRAHTNAQGTGANATIVQLTITRVA